MHETMILNPLFRSYRTIFLDRDGVLNRRLPDAYVRSRAEWEWLPGACEAIATIAALMERVILVTNQQGIGKGLMTTSDLDTIHQHMLTDIRNAGGRLDAVYHCPDLRNQTPNCRKPGPGMALLARRDFPEIDFHTSIMVGDMPDDILFGRQLGMYTIQCGDELTRDDAIPDNRISSLAGLPDLLTAPPVKK